MKKFFTFILVFIWVLIAAYVARSYYKDKQFEKQREYAVKVCQEKGGYRTTGPVTVPGYKRKYSSFDEYAQPLLEEGYQFIEAQGVWISGVRRSPKNNPEEAYSRFTLEKRPSPLCERYDKYLPHMYEREKNRLKELGLKESQCIGVETFLDPELLRSKYEFIHVNEYDQRVPAIVWNKTQVRHILTGDLISELAVFSGCLDGKFQMEPFYNGCWGGARNIVMCPIEPNDWDLSGQVKALFEEAFLPEVRKQD